MNKFLLFLIILKFNFLITKCQNVTHFYDMYWEEIGDCLDPEDRVVDISSIQIKKITRSIVGITGIVDVKENINKGFTIEISVTKKTITNQWLPIEISEMTSIRHDGCKLMEHEKKYIAKILDKAQIPKQCPLEEGLYTMLNETINFELPKFIMPSCYKIQLKLFDIDDNVLMCGAAAIKVVPTGEGPFPRCV